MFNIPLPCCQVKKFINKSRAPNPKILNLDPKNLKTNN